MPPPSGAQGLTAKTAAMRLAEDGRNEMPSAERRTALAQVLGVLREPMLLLLLVATASYVVFGDVAEAAALGVSVIAIVTITIVQERRTESARCTARARLVAHAITLLIGPDSAGEQRAIDRELRRLRSAHH